MLRTLAGIATTAALLTGISAANAQVAPDAVLTQTITEKSLSLHYEILAANAAIDACSANHVHVTVVMVDSRGNVKLQMVGDGGNSNLLEEARRKARTAALMRQSTSALAQALAANPGMRFPPDTDFLVIQGGAPIRALSETVGAIGVAGGAHENVENCAQAGVDLLNEFLHPEEPHPNVLQPSVAPAGAPR